MGYDSSLSSVTYPRESSRFGESCSRISIFPVAWHLTCIPPFMFGPGSAESSWCSLRPACFSCSEGEDPCCEGCDHLHGELSPLRSVFAAFVLVVPMLVAATVSPDQFGAATVTNRGFIERINDLPSYKPFVEPLLPAADGSQRQPGLRAPARAICQRTKRARSKPKLWIFIYAAEEPTMRADFENKDGGIDWTVHARAREQSRR